MPILVHDGNFFSIQTNNITTTGNLTIDGTLNVQGNISGNLAAPISDNSIYIQQLQNNLFTVPYYFGQRLNISEYVDNLRIRTTFLNNYDVDLVFSAPPVESIQVWLNYYNSTGGTMSNPDIPMSTAFYPGNIAVLDYPNGTIPSGDTFFYDLQLEDLHIHKPDAAKAWSVTIRPVSDTRGTMDIGLYVPITLLAITPWAS